MRGFVFTLDAMFALMLVAATVPLIILLTTAPIEVSEETLKTQANSAIGTLSELTVRNVIREPVFHDLYTSGKISNDDLDKNVLDYVLEKWSSNSTENYTIAANVTQSLLYEMFGRNISFSFSVENDTLVDTGGVPSYIATGRRIASGYMKGEKSAGYVSSVFLSSIGSRQARSYFFFGGFVGQGNITAQLGDIVAGASVSEIYLELKAGENFTLYANGAKCGQFNVTPGNFSVDSWTMGNCSNRIYPGAENNLSINFTSSNITNQFIGGGYLRVTYTTDNLLEENPVKYRFPGIDGLINLYDSFYVPGNITGMNATVKFFSPANHTTVINVGNITVLNHNGTGEDTTVTIDNATFASLLAAKGITFYDLSEKTMPLRMFVGANITSGLMNGTADIVLITDTSGSMAWRLNQDSVNGNVIDDCSNPNVYISTTARISLAKCLDKSFVNALLGGNNSACAVSSRGGNRIAFVSFSTSVNNWENLTDNISYLESRINAYTANGFTCISCAINQAYNILNQSGENRSRYIVVMTDGVANMRSTNTCSAVNDMSLDIAVGDSTLRRGPPWISVNNTAMNAVSALNTTFARAVANAGEIYKWNGGWTLEQNIGSTNIYSVDILNKTFGFAAGASAKIWRWDGTAWLESNDFGNFNFRGITLFNSTLGFAVGDSGVIYQWNGTNWTFTQDVGTADLYGVAAQSGTLAFATGSSGKIYQWSGASWTEATDTGSNIHYNVIFINSTKAFTASSNGRIYEWNGASWSSIILSSYSLNGIYAVNSTLAYAAGNGRGDVYEWNGNTWTRTYSDFYYKGNSTTGLDCSDDDSCPLTLVQSYSAMNANYSAGRARQIGNLTIDAVGFGPIGTCTLGNQTITEIAKTGNGTAYNSANATELQDIYCQIAANILTKTTETQQVITQGALQPSILYPDSSIDFSYVPSAPPVVYQEISTDLETDKFQGCSGDLFVPSNLRLIDVLRTSYSGFFWTKNMQIQNSINTNVYNLSLYGKKYADLGDPFRVYLPIKNIAYDEVNTIINTLGLNATQSSANCSSSDRIIYRARLRASAPYGNVFPELMGGIARVYYDINHDGNADGFTDITYGASLPRFNNTLRTMDQLNGTRNALDDAVIRMMNNLNFLTFPADSGVSGSSTNPIDIRLSVVNVAATGAAGVPFAWGPLDIRLDVKI